MRLSSESTRLVPLVVLSLRRLELSVETSGRRVQAFWGMLWLLVWSVDFIGLTKKG